MRLRDRLPVPGLLIVFVLVAGCAGGVEVPDLSLPQEAKPPSSPTIDPSGCNTVICCSDCPGLVVDRIIDGDTFASADNRIRVFGIDTPERGEKCFDEATDRLREIAGDTVRVEHGPRAEDQYGRTLFYLYTESGESIDEILVREGLAIAWKRDGQHRDELASAEEKARREGRGCLW